MAQVDINESNNIYTCTPSPQNVVVNGTLTFVNSTDSDCDIKFGSPTGGCNSFTVPAHSNASCKAGPLPSPPNFTYSCTPKNGGSPGSGIIIVDPIGDDDDQGEQEGSAKGRPKSSSKGKKPAPKGKSAKKGRKK
jgi:hypothetical protein